MSLKKPNNSQVCAYHQVSMYTEEKWQTQDCKSLLPDQMSTQNQKEKQGRGKFVEMGKYGGMFLLMEREQLLKQKMKDKTKAQSFPKTRDKFRTKNEKKVVVVPHTHFLVGQDKFSHSHSYNEHLFNTALKDRGPIQESCNLNSHVSLQILTRLQAFFRSQHTRIQFTRMRVQQQCGHRRQNQYLDPAFHCLFSLWLGHFHPVTHIF